jgi:hypothetical protein
MYRIYAAQRQKEEIFENAEAQMARFPLFQNYTIVALDESSGLV